MRSLLDLHDIALIIFSFFSEILGTLSGFGSSTFFVPLAQIFASFQFVLAITAILHCFGNLSKLILFRQFFSKDIVLRFAVPSVLLTVVGAYFSDSLSLQWIHKTLGLVLILISIVTLIRSTSPRKISSKMGLVLISVSGFLTGFVGTGGALRGAALSTLQLQKETFIFISAAIDIGGDLLRAGIYLQKGYMPWDHWFFVPLLGIAALGGSWVGKKIVMRINQKAFEKIVAVFILISGLTMVFS